MHESKHIEYKQKITSKEREETKFWGSITLREAVINVFAMYLQPAIEQGLVALTIPDKPTSSKQQYYLTEKGKEVFKHNE